MKAIRAPEFGARFRQSCDLAAQCPQKGDGRYIWIIKQYQKLTGVTLAPENCRKWHEGEAQPRRDKTPILAEIFGVNPVWLETGSGSPTPALSPNEIQSETALSKANSISSILSFIPIPIRPNVDVEIRNLPHNLTRIEADRICGVIQAYVDPRAQKP
ncbi:MAG: hypothetical protein KGL44_03010 [Sphingomonadales bacterium]|nr:hypothetical protein [Sphingomonadales bacterium]